jgi:hypothetical protein
MIFETLHRRGAATWLARTEQREKWQAGRSGAILLHHKRGADSMSGPNSPLSRPPPARSRLRGLRSRRLRAAAAIGRTCEPGGAKINAVFISRAHMCCGKRPFLSFRCKVKSNVVTSHTVTRASLGLPAADHLLLLF